MKVTERDVGLVSISGIWFRYRGCDFDIAGVVLISLAWFRCRWLGFDIVDLVLIS